MNIFERAGVPVHNRKPFFHIGEEVTWKEFSEYIGYVEGIEVKQFCGFVYSIRYQLLYGYTYEIELYKRGNTERKPTATKNLSQSKLKRASRRYRVQATSAKTAKPKKLRKKPFANMHRVDTQGKYKKPIHW